MDFIALLNYALPAGFLASIVTWLVDRKLIGARASREKQAIFTQMYDEIKKLLADESAEKNQLYRAVSRLERAVSKIGNCLYVDGCPVRHELRQQARGTQKRKRGERSNEHEGAVDDHGASGIESPTNTLDGEPP